MYHNLDRKVAKVKLNFYMIQENTTLLERVNICGGLNDKARINCDYSRAAFSNVFNYRNIVESGLQCCKGVRWKRSTQLYEINILRWSTNLKNHIDNREYNKITRGFDKFTISERGKIREIQSVHISERCIQKLLVQKILRPIIEPKLIYNNGANIKNKGVNFILKELKKDLSRAYKKWGNDFYIVTLDYKNYYRNINHQKILSQIKEYLDDEAFELISVFVNSFDGDVGIGLGSEISQLLGSLYPNNVDRYAKHYLHLDEYGRYNDDIHFMTDSLEYAKECVRILSIISGELGLCFNENKIRFYKNNFTFIKKRIILTDTGKIIIKPAKDSIKRERKKLRKLIDKENSNLIEKGSAKKSFNSWKGCMKNLNAYDTISSVKQELERR